LLPDENDHVLAEFLEGANEKSLQYSGSDPNDDKKQADNPANVVPIQLPTGQPTRFGWQLLPTDSRTDGFYYALLEKA